jgi:hypothetical protein
MSRSDAPEPDTHALVQALPRLPPDEIDAAVRPIAPDIADLLLDQQQAHASEMAKRTVQETIREINRERTRILTKDQLRLLVFGQDKDVAKLAAAELLTREPTSNRTLAHANGDIAGIGYDHDGSIYANVHRAGTPGHWMPATGKA